LASAVTDLLGDNEKRNLMASKSKEYISRFAPKVIAQQLASLYEV
jgi:UDP-N-acetylglucosamine:LPS N-acetylglucosamine transferase